MNLKPSVILLTRNPGPSFQETLEGVFRQDLKPYEVLVIDSSSTDGTPSLVQRYPVRWVQIKPEAFGHGRTRNLGGTLAKGDILVFLTQDAVPAQENWLSSLMHPLEETASLAGVYGRQIPRGSDPFEAFCRYYTYPSAPRCYGVEDAEKFSAFYILFSNVNAAIRKTFLERFPFEESLIMSEDQEWARRILRGGFKIQYEPRAAVYHSHREGLSTLFKRSFDAGVSFQQMSCNGTLHALPHTWSYLLAEVKFLSKNNKLFWIPLLLPRETLRAYGFLMGRYARRIPKRMKRWISFHSNYWGK